ncbi:MAG TPA: DUF6265 family protein [Thermoanaerobaculia bacterium]|jgi:hypothetical protein
MTNRARTLGRLVRVLAALGMALVSPVLLATPGSEPEIPGWMAGTWTGVSDGTEMEEVWTPAKGGSMLGLHRDVKDGRTVEFEFLRIEAAPGGVTYWASPLGRPPTPFRMAASESGPNRVVFTNPKHDFPTRILYWLSADGLLHARIEGTLKGKPASEEWSWKKAS